MIWKLDYINLYISARKNLHSKNIEKLDVNKINHIGKLYNENYFDHYKKQTFFRWFNENIENSENFLKRAKKLIKKLNIEFNSSEQEKINVIEPREFTMRRTLKSIEVPYKELKVASKLQPNAFFFYKEVRLYSKNLTLYKQIFKGEIYMTSKELVFYSRENNKVYKSISNDDINEITLKNYAVIIKIRNEEDLIIRYRDNELIYISLNRIVVFRKTIEFVDDSYTTERTIESIFNFDQN